MNDNVADFMDTDVSIIKDEQKEFTYGSIGCCHLYYQCSIEKKCINLYTETQKECSYKKNLEEGRIFYSKNANDFSMQKYQELLEKYNLLNLDLKNYLNNVLHYFINYKRLSEHSLFLRTAMIDECVEKGLLSDDKIHSHTLLNLFTFKYLKSLLSESKSFKKKEELIDYIVNVDLTALKHFYTKFIYVHFDRSLFKYYQEIYLDNNIKNEVEANFENFLQTIDPNNEDMMKK